MGMPTDVQISLQGFSNLPEDRYINTLHFDGDDFSGGNADELWSKYDAWLTFVGGGLAQGGHTIKAYQPGPNPSGPYMVREYERASAIPSSMPGEVAICLSYAAVDDPEQSTPRRRGRIYLGPLSASGNAASRPGPSIRDAVLDLGEGIAQVGTAQELTWMLYSPSDASYHKIESIWCDDSWDTQRRRGLAPTLREVRDVQ